MRYALYSYGLLVSLLPRSIEMILGVPLGFLFMLVLPSRRRVVMANLAYCFPEMSLSKRRRLMIRNYIHYGRLLLEIGHMGSPFKGHYRKYILKNSSLLKKERLDRALKAGKGAILVASHMGNWEFMVASGALDGIDVTMVTKHLKPEWFHKIIEDTRLSCGVKAAYDPRTLPTVIKSLQKGGVVGFVMDQYAGPPMGIPVEFFGAKVGSLRAVATLAKKYSCPVLPVRTVRGPDGMIYTLVEEEIDLSVYDFDEEKSTEYLLKILESWARTYPDQWYWIHRRFKNVLQY